MSFSLVPALLGYDASEDLSPTRLSEVVPSESFPFATEAMLVCLSTLEDNLSAVALTCDANTSYAYERMYNRCVEYVSAYTGVREF